MLLGRLPPSRIAAIEEHLDVCPECLASVDTLEVSSHVVDMLSARPAAQLAPARTDLEPLIKSLDVLHSVGDAALATAGDTPTLMRSADRDELGRLAHFRVL